MLWGIIALAPYNKAAPGATTATQRPISSRLTLMLQSDHYLIKQLFFYRAVQ